MSAALLAIAALGASLVSQNLPPELRAKQRAALDPYLPAALADAVKAASDAEIDPKRGPGNAVELLRAERTKYAGDLRMEMAVDLRIAATVLRARFRNNHKVPPETRWAQALSTFSKLDVADPGFGWWVDRTVESWPGAEAKLAGRKVKLAVLTRGSGIDRDEVFARLADGLSKAGFKAERAAPKASDFVATLVADELREAGGEPIVRVTLGLERMVDGKPGWRNGMYRSAKASEAKAALASNVEWLCRMGARDVVLRRLDEAGVDGVYLALPGGGKAHGPDDGHGHGAPPSKVRLPQGGKTEPRPGHGP